MLLFVEDLSDCLLHEARCFKNNAKIGMGVEEVQERLKVIRKPDLPCSISFR